MAPSPNPAPPLPPLALGVCSWSLQVASIAELRRLLDRLGINVAQIACGDPNHASWDEGDAMPEAARASGILLTGAMLGFPGEDYTTPATIKATGGFGNPADRPDRLERLRWALDRTVALGLSDLMLHAGFLPELDDPDRPAMLDTLARAGQLAAREGGHAGLRDRTGDRRAAPPDPRRPESAQPEGQFRSGQHAPLRHGRPDPRRRPARPRHPERPRQGCEAADDPRPVGRGSAARPRARSTSGGSSGPCSGSATPDRSSSSARSATRPGGSATSRTAWTSSANASPTGPPPALRIRRPGGLPP